MTALLELQRSFAGAILDTERVPPDDVTSHATKHPVRRFNVYRNNVATSLVDVLEAYFPVVARLVGSDFFRAMARAFAAASPPTSPILSRYGAEFPAFLEAFPPVQDLPYLADVARLEWLRQRAYHAADAAPLKGDDLATTEASKVHELVFRPHPSSGLVASSYPVVSIWRTNTQDDEVAHVDSEGGGEFALIVRPHLAVHVVPLSAGAHAFATALLGGKPLGAAAMDAQATGATFDLQGALATLIEQGALAGFASSSSGSSLRGKIQS